MPRSAGPPALPQALYLPLRQHQGPAGTLLVEPGAHVLKGQPLSRADTDREVPVHASTSGTVEAIRTWPVSWPPGGEAECLVLKPDGEETWCERKPLPSWRKAGPDALIEFLRGAGLAGLGGAMFPTAAKLRGNWPQVNTLILNGSECEPYISCDEMLMRERPEAVVEGGLILARAWAPAGRHRDRGPDGARSGIRWKACWQRTIRRNGARSWRSPPSIRKVAKSS